MKKIAKALTAALGAALLSGAALIGVAAAAQPVDWHLNLQPAATEKMQDIHAFHDLLLWIIIGISVFVLVLLLYVMIRFNKRSNPVPSKTTHHVGLEVAWTVIPVIILVIIAIPSFRLLYKIDTIPKDIGLTVKAIGLPNWAWSYEYPDLGVDPETKTALVSFPSNMLSDEDAAAAGKPRLLGVDNYLVVPVNTKVRVQVTAIGDKIHAWTVPAFGVKVDAVPGRINQLWFEATETGFFYGQCSELCGVRHAFMPIGVHVVTQEEFDAWSKQQVAAAKGETQVSAAQ
jgi:cytochrome c oxidase subunit II